MDELIRHNLELMKSNEEGGLQYLLGKESLGGNAGCFEGQPCQGANFFYDAADGKIIYFGNWQNVPPEIRTKNQSGTFKVVWPLGTIVNYYLNQEHHDPLPNTTPLARTNLEGTILQYNHWRNIRSKTQPDRELPNKSNFLQRFERNKRGSKRG